jgi:hypothetical protein
MTSGRIAFQTKLFRDLHGGRINNAAYTLSKIQILVVYCSSKPDSA